MVYRLRHMSTHLSLPTTRTYYLREEHLHRKHPRVCPEDIDSERRPLDTADPCPLGQSTVIQAIRTLDGRWKALTSTRRRAEGLVVGNNPKNVPTEKVLGHLVSKTEPLIVIALEAPLLTAVALGARAPPRVAISVVVRRSAYRILKDRRRFSCHSRLSR